MTKISAARPAVASHPREKAADLKPIATAFGLGKLVSTERGPMGRVLHNYANGTLVTKGGSVHSLEVSDVENSPVLLSKELIDLALKNKLGAFQTVDHAMGGRSAYAFARGSINFQGNKMTGVELYPTSGWQP